MSDSLAPSEPLPTSPNTGLTAPQRRMLAVFEIVLCSSVPTQLAIGYVLTLGGWSATTASGALSLPYVLTLSLADTLLLIVLMVVLLHAHGEDATSLWLGERSVRRADFIWVSLISCLFLFLLGLFNTPPPLFPHLHNAAAKSLETPP